MEPDSSTHGIRGHPGRLTVVDIPHDQTDDEMARVILRLEQMGDGIGTRVSDEEVEGFIRLLRTKQPAVKVIFSRFKDYQSVSILGLVLTCVRAT
jgi:hypothetical protein